MLALIAGSREGGADNIDRVPVLDGTDTGGQKSRRVKDRLHEMQKKHTNWV